MSPSVISVFAIALYALAAWYTARALARATDRGTLARWPGLGFGYAALAAHAVILLQSLVTATGLDLSVFNTASLVAWLIVLLVLIGALTKPVENLAVILLPVAAVAIALERLLPGHRILPADAPLGLEAHVALSILAYSLFSIAALQALMLAFAEYQLRHKRPALVVRLLPPLATMEDLLFQVLAAGMAFLTLGLVSGFMFVDDFMAQHLLHKTVLSLIAWVIFATLLWGRLRRGWRGRIAVRYTLAGFLVLMLAFFGSKLVLERILRRV
jgi:ABC-type uncharacterized transport system permease subunit